MTDEDHATAVQKAIRELNRAACAARDAGLWVDIRIDDMAFTGRRTYQIVFATVSKLVKGRETIT